MAIKDSNFDRLPEPVVLILHSFTHLTNYTTACRHCHLTADLRTDSMKAPADYPFLP